MGKNILFLSHSSKDLHIVTAFVDFMCKIGIKNTDIVCSSVSSTKLPVNVNIYDYLNSLIADEKIYVVYFLSDNYYSSPDCLNEMGAAWLRKADSLALLLSGFDFEDMRGVIDKKKISIKLGNCDSMAKASFNDFKSTLEKLFDINIDYNCWELARDEFLKSTIEDNRKFNMQFSRSYCIGDLENEGCKIIKKNSSFDSIKLKIDFNETESKLSSLVFFCGNRDFTSYFINKKNLCFEAYADKGISFVDVEFKLDDIDMLHEICLDDDEKSFKIPLIQFCDTLSFWKNVSEIKFVFHRKKISNSGEVIIKNLRIE